MEAYTDFASVYDIFMDDTPYEEWASYIMDLLEEYGVAEGDLPEAESARQKALAVERNVVVDLGCGTGTLTELLADRGCDMIGIDASQEMLNPQPHLLPQPQSPLYYYKCVPSHQALFPYFINFVCVCVCVCVCTCTVEHICTGQRLTSSVIPQILPMYFIEILYIFMFSG